MIDNPKINQFDSSESDLPTGISFIQGVFWLLVSSEFLIILAKALGYESANKISWVEILLGTMVNLTVLLSTVMKIIFPLHFLTMIWILLLIAVYIRHIFKTEAVPQDKKALWAVVIFCGNMVAMPVYWYLYIWKKTESMQF